MKRFASFAVAVALASGMAGCGGAQQTGLVTVGSAPFTAQTLNDPDNTRAKAAVVAKLAAAPLPPVADAVVAVTGDNEVTGLDLSTGKTWTFTHPLSVRPRLAGTLVIGQGGGEIFALDALTGSPRWKLPIDGALIGAGNDGTMTALTLRTRAGSALIVVGASGQKVLQKQIDLPLGVPAIAAGMVFVPWKSIYVTAFEIASGAQLGSFVADVEATRVVPIGGALFAGQGRLARIDADLAKEVRTNAAIASVPDAVPSLARKDLFLAPDHDGVIKDDALDQTAIAWRPTTTGAAGFAADRVYAAYYKVVVGFGAKDGAVAWVLTGKDDVDAAAAASDGVVLVDEGGNVRLVSSGGAVVKTMSLGKPTWSADASVGALTIGGGAAAKPLVQQMREAVLLRDDQLATAQLLIVQQLAKTPDPDATAVLLDVADAEHTSLAMRDEARKSIALRRSGGDAMIAALARRTSFLHDVHAPPVGPMATALAAMNDTRAASALAAQLEDPALPQRDLLETAQGLATLATLEQLPALQSFVLMYRGSATGNLALTDAVAIVCKAIVRLKHGEGRAWVGKVMADALTDLDVKTALQKMLDADAAPAAAAPTK